MSYGLDLGWGGPIGDYVVFWGRPIEGSTTNIVQGSYNVAVAFMKSPSLMCFHRRLFRTWPLFGSPSLMCFVLGALKIRDRSQTIPFKIISKASRGTQYRGTLVRHVYFPFFWGPYCCLGGGGGGGQIR